jgi:hypothetical protein
MTDDQKLYEAAKLLVSANRCATCEHHQKGVCEFFGPVPDEHLYKPNWCEKYMVLIPF